MKIMTLFDCSTPHAAKAGWPGTLNLAQKKTDSKKACFVEMALLDQSFYKIDAFVIVPFCTAYMFKSYSAISGEYKCCWNTLSIENYRR